MRRGREERGDKDFYDVKLRFSLNIIYRPINVRIPLLLQAYLAGAMVLMLVVRVCGSASDQLRCGCLIPEVS